MQHIQYMTPKHITQHHSTLFEQRNQITRSPLLYYARTKSLTNTHITTNANTKSHVRQRMEMQLHLLRAQIYERSFQIAFTRRGSSSDVQVYPTAQIGTAEIKKNSKNDGHNWCWN
jgi:hypothetical protein